MAKHGPRWWWTAERKLRWHHQALKEAQRAGDQDCYAAEKAAIMASYERLGILDL